MIGLRRSIQLNEDFIQQCWKQRYNAENDKLAEELERQIWHRGRDEDEDQNQLLRVQEQLQRPDTTGNMEDEQGHKPRVPTAQPPKPSIWNPGEGRHSSNHIRAENLVLY